MATDEDGTRITDISRRIEHEFNQAREDVKQVKEELMSCQIFENRRFTNLYDALRLTVSVAGDVQRQIERLGRSFQSEQAAIV
jgi:hypothetical protein